MSSKRTPDKRTQADDTGAGRSVSSDLVDLMKRLRFSMKDGRIWLNEQRMLLLNANAFGEFRKEVIDAVGVELARGLLTRMGYRAGGRDAQEIRRLRTKSSVKNMFLAGPNLHCLMGIGHSARIELDVDVEKGTHFGELVWTNQMEDEEHIRHFEIGTDPACWIQIGYVSGYCSELLGKPVLYREVECLSMGHTQCRIVGKPLEEWSEEEAQDMRYMLAGAPPDDGAASHRVREATAPAVLAASVGSGENQMIGNSPAFHAVQSKVSKVAPTLATILLLGESGVGKEIFARNVHRLSPRKNGPFIALNCAAIPEQLIESELFGVERGAYTGAEHTRKGRFEAASGGTIFLDEIGTLSAGAQSKLLRALQEGEIERLGDTQARRIDVRVIAATNVDLRTEARAGRFREDLFFRLNVFPIKIPPLRERYEDIPALMSYFLGKFNRRHGCKLSGFSQRAVDAMMSYDWPGNIRELENMIERGVIMAADTDIVDAPHLFTDGEQFGDQRFSVSSRGKLAPALNQPFTEDRDSGGSLEDTIHRLEGFMGGAETVSLNDIETLLLRRAITSTNGNVAAAARILGITRPQMDYRLRSHGIEVRNP
ncbi:sigma 54-interacting transcriptional regulator [Pandoraea pnomenusa]|uniref:sigma 54-interacting transcriptional regulator n=1 Tax=Pandoraea pnomenusa TaxID=93220 RepID=UPI003342A41C